MSVMMMTRGMKKKVEEAAVQESAPSPKSINDLPPEVLEMILKKLDYGENSLLLYRLVHPTWKQLINDLMEKKNLKGELVACVKAVMVMETDWEGTPVPTISCRSGMLCHPGNPFPSSCLLVMGPGRGRKRGRTSKLPLETFTTKFGTHLKIVTFSEMWITFDCLILTLRHLSNLRILKLSATEVKLNLESDFDSFPALPHLTTLELLSCRCFVSGKDLQEHFCPKFVNAYAGQLTSLKLGIAYIHMHTALGWNRVSTDYDPFMKLQELKIYNLHGKFLRFCCTPPLKNLSVVGVLSIWEPEVDVVNADVLMRFVDKFSNTLESLTLDVQWDQIFDVECRQKAVETGGILQTAAVIFPKLKYLTLVYPTSEMEATVIKKSFLPKFPALQQLHLLNYELPKVRDYEKTLKKIVDQDNYSGVCNTLTRVSVWYSGEYYGLKSKDNYIVHSQSLLHPQI